MSGGERQSALNDLLVDGPWSESFGRRILDSVQIPGLESRAALGWHRLLEAAGSLESLPRLVSMASDHKSVHGKSRTGVLEGLSVLLGASPYFTDLIAADPKRVERVLELGPLYRHRSRDSMGQSLRGILDGQSGVGLEQRTALVAEWQRIELLRLGWRDYGNLSDPETNARELSDLADVAIRWACREAWIEATARYGRPEWAPGDSTEEGAAEGTESSFLIVGMGKLGGRELNFSSDIDLVFVYDAEGQTSGRADGGGIISHHQFFGQLGERVSRILGHRGSHGQFYRVDLRLRPEGKLGPVARSLESLAAYFSEQARDWERVSWLKARAITGSDQLIHRFEQVVTGFVYSTIQPERMFSEVESLKQRIDAAIGEAESGLCMDVKRGRGGIREIEFTATVLQILYGNRHRALRVRPLLLALARLAHVGLISGNDPTTLALNYGHLRRVEHRLQMEHGRQEHRLPPLGERRDVLAASLGLGDGDGLTRFMDQVTEAVHAWYSRFFEADRGASTEEDSDVALILSPVADPDQQIQALKRRGFSQANTAKLLYSLTFGTSEVFVSAAGQRAFEQLVPSLLRLAAGRPRPDQVIVHLHSLMQRLQSASYYYEVLAGHPGVLRMVTFLFGTSDHLSEVLLAHPEYFDRLIQGDILEDATQDGRLSAMRKRLHDSLVSASNRQAQRRVLRKAAEFEILVTHLGWLVNLTTFEETLASLSDGADGVIAAALRLALAEVSHRNNMTPEEHSRLQEAMDRRFAIMALGKYGSRELNFRGDLDVLFLQSDEGPEIEPGLAEAVLQELSGLLSEGEGVGRGHVLDTRLRPWGNDGPLVAGEQEFIRYVIETAAPWEFLSYQRMRCVLGEQGWVSRLVDTIPQLIRQALETRISPGEFLGEVVTMRVKLEEHSAHGTGLELKRSLGGLMDAEFALEAWLVLGCPGLPDSEELTRPGRSHFEWWVELRTLGVGPEGVAEDLGESHRILRLAENISRTVLGSTSSTLPAPQSSEQSRALWRNLQIVGIPDTEAIIQRKQVMRQAYTRWMDWLAQAVGNPEPSDGN